MHVSWLLMQRLLIWITLLLCAQIHINAQFLPLPELPYQYEELEPDFDGMEVRRHFHEVFGLHVERFNSALKQLRHTPAYSNILKKGGIDGLIRRIGDVPGALQRKLRYHCGGYVNHELFFRTLRPRRTDAFAAEVSNTPEAGCAFSAAIEQRFGSFQIFQKEFGNMAKGLHGVGWIWLVVDTAVERIADGSLHLHILETSVNDHPLMASSTFVPLLCLDVWEHAYFGQFHNSRKRYVEAWWNLVDWEEVTRIYSNVDLESRLNGISSPSLDIVEGGSVFVPVPTQDDLSPVGNVTATMQIEAEWKLKAESNGSNACWESLFDFLTRMQPSSHLEVRLLCGNTDARSISNVDAIASNGISKLSRLAAGTMLYPSDVVLEWPSEFVLKSRGTLASHGIAGGVLGELVVTLLAENRYIDSSWHDYLEYLHGAFEHLRRSALFWPRPCLNLLNVSVGLDNLRLAARAHRGAAKVFEQVPELLAPGDSSQVSGDERSQALFDAEIHWAVSSALCRSVASEEYHSITGTKRSLEIDANSLLPGSELIRRGDSRQANVRIQRIPANSAEAMKWQLVATSPIHFGDELVLDSGLSNVELLASSWPIIEQNTRGPTLVLPAIDQTVVSHIASLASHSHEQSKRIAQAGMKWQEQDCAENLHRPHLKRDEKMGFAQALVLCIAYAIRLLEASQADIKDVIAKPSLEDDHQENLSSCSDGAAAMASSAEILHRAYGLIAQACEEGSFQRRVELATFVSSDMSKIPWELEIATKLRAAIEDEVMLLDNCASNAKRQSAKSLAKVEAGTPSNGASV